MNRLHVICSLNGLSFSDLVSETFFLKRLLTEMYKINFSESLALLACIFMYLLVFFPGQTIKGHLVCKKNRRDPRSLTITMTVDGVTQNFMMQ